MSGFDHPDEQLQHEAEELMRQRRFSDAATRYSDLVSRAPTDLWASLGHISALECAGQLDEARSLLERLAGNHRRSASFQRFRHLFFIRREDFAAATVSRRALQDEVIDDGADDQLADLYFNQGRYHEAAGELERLLSAGSEDNGFTASVQARLGACRRQLGDPTAARKHLLASLDAEPGHPWALSELAEAERALGNAEAARERYREALAAAPDDHWTRGHLAQLEHEVGNFEESIALYEQVIASEPPQAWARVELAQALTERDAARSAALCNEALDLDPRNPWAHAQLGALAKRAGKFDEARAHLLRAHQGAPTAVWVLHELADVCRQLGRRDEAQTHLDRAMAEDPYNPITFGYAADALRHDNRHAEALANLAKALEIDPAYTWAWRETAELHALAGRHDLAEEAYAKACELEPDAPINDGLKAFLLRCQGRRNATIPYLERAVERHPGYQWAWREHLETLLADNRDAEAATLGERAVAANPDVAALHGMLAEALRRLAQHDASKRPAAEAAITRALALDEGIPQLWAIRAELSAESGDLATAEQAARNALTLGERQGSGGEYAALLAQILAAGGRDREAEAVLTGPLERNPTLQPAWELASMLAERRGDLPRAAAICDRALAGPLANDPRLAIRRARLGLSLGEDAQRTADALAPLVDRQAHGIPWRDAAQILAQGGRASEARQAVLHGLAAAGDDASARRRARIAMAEIELLLGDAASADKALAAVLSEEPDHIQARLLGAVVADHRGDLAGAIAHLDRLATRIPDHHDPRGAHDPVPATVLRQLAGLCERNGDLDRAANLWEKVLATPGIEEDERIDYALFRVRHHGIAAAAAVVAETEQILTTGSAGHLRFLRELALATTRHDGAASGSEVLRARSEHLDPGLRLLQARLAVAAGHHTQARSVLEPGIAGLDDEDQKEAAILLARAKLGDGDAIDAANVAEQAWVASGHRAEEPATVLAECHACQGSFAEALRVLHHPSLPALWSLERAVLGAVVAGESQGAAWLIGCLARHGRPRRDEVTLPVARVLATAWPEAWASTADHDPATIADLTAVPPFPNLARRLAHALCQAGHADLAAAHLRAVLAFHRRHGLARTTPLDRRLRRALCDALCRAGRRGEALIVAAAGLNLRALLRCCVKNPEIPA